MRRLARMMDGWGWPVLLTGGGTVAAILNNWKPWEIVALAAVLGVAGAMIAAVGAWYDLRTRAIELAALSSDEQAARLLGEALGRCDHFLEAEASREVWGAFNAAPSRAKRAMTLAVLGFLSQEYIYETAEFNEKIVALARSFLRPAELPAPAPETPAPHPPTVAAP